MLKEDNTGAKISGKAGKVTGEMPVDTGAEAFVTLLNANNTDYIFMNPGTDTLSIQEALSKFKAIGKDVPTPILCLDESEAMAAAHGYFMVSGKPQVVLVHVDLGTQQVGGALHNAQRGRIGVILCAGRSPSIFEGEKVGGRSSAIMWWQEQFDQAGVVRNYIKWDYELRFNENIHHVIQRAFQVASTEPCGPVYLVLPREVLMERIEKVQILNTTRYKATSTPQADNKMLTEAAKMLLQAENPLIITGYSGRHTHSVASLVELAETLGARVITSEIRMNFPNTHPLCSGIDSTPYIAQADIILVIDHDVPYVPTMARPNPDAKIIHIDIDPIKQTMPMWGFPVDISLQADSSKAIPVLTEIIRQRVTPQQQSHFQARFRQYQSENEQLQAKWRDLAVTKAEQRPISPEWLSHCIAEVVDEDTIILNEVITNRASLAHQIQRTKPGTSFSSGGSNLGWGLGAALGAKLAAPDKTVVSLMSDGCFLFGCPTETLWAADVYHAPFLCIIFNNEGYNAVRTHLRNAFGKDNFAEKDSFFAGLDITPPPNYALIAQASNAYGETVQEPSDVKTALRRALERVKSGKAAVLDIRIEKA
ncbi:thiamine pyrophosphate-requiring protein [Chloroflexota bacterium]